MDFLDRLVLMIVLYLTLGACEFAFPAERGQASGERIRNLAITGLFLIAGGALTSFVFSLIPWSSFSNESRDPYTEIEAGMLVFVALFLTDFVFYWYHRAQHTLPWLWPIHELHHTDQNLNVTTSLRTQLFENPLQALLISVPVAFAMRLDAETALLFAVTLVSWEFFTHANIRLSFGAFTPVMTGPQLHRIHHSRLPEHRDKNFAQYFPIFDLLFGTYAAPRPNEFPPTGVEGKSTNVPLVDAIVHPVVAWASVDRRYTESK